MPQKASAEGLQATKTIHDIISECDSPRTEYCMILSILKYTDYISPCRISQGFVVIAEREQTSVTTELPVDTIACENFFYKGNF